MALPGTWSQAQNKWLAIGREGGFAGSPLSRIASSQGYRDYG